jgi:hypothetical protein
VNVFNKIEGQVMIVPMSLTCKFPAIIGMGSSALGQWAPQVFLTDPFPAVCVGGPMGSL